ncbi:MAG: hypothetical protein FJY88_02325 [Candidatus Eisenbacteria bacterium]|nr:hypothetical protein [Candidatus Eisenbacteria bacterium]
MRKVFAIAAVGLLALTLPAFADVATFDVNDGIPAGGTGGRFDCAGDITVYWDTGMYDEYTPPSSTAYSGGCFVNAINAGDFPADGRRGADDWICYEERPITAIKLWARYNLSGWAYRHNVGGLHGFCVKFYEAVDMGGMYPWCPDGTIAGEGAIGTIVYNEYVPTGQFTTVDITTGMARHEGACIYLHPAFFPVLDKWYWTSVTADFDFDLYDDPGTPAVDTGVTQWFHRMYPGLGISVCEASWWDTWNDPATNWTGVSIIVPGWATWDSAWVIYWGEPPIATESTTWGKIKANYR